MPKGESEKPKEKKSPGVKGTAGDESDKPQRLRFIDAARESESDESGEAFEKAFAAIVPPRKAPSV